MFVSLSAFAKGPLVVTQPGKVGTLWRLQGEYAGESGGQRTGLHVVAVGRNSLRAVVYEGGLPGDGWTGEIEVFPSAPVIDEVVVFQSARLRVVVDGKSAILERLEGNASADDSATLLRVTRQSKTLQAAPPDNAIKLFSGKGARKWTNARVHKKSLLVASNCSTRQKFGDHSLHLEFRLPFMPEDRAQHRGNSGVYLQSRYEIQLLDSFGEATPRHNSCGGIYEFGTPTLNMCYPPLTWQTLDVDFTAARWEGDTKVRHATMTVRLNGVTIHDNLELPSHTPGRWKEKPSPGKLFLQDQGDFVVFRNIWVVPR